MSYIIPDAEYMLINAASATTLDNANSFEPGSPVHGWRPNIQIRADHVPNQIWRAKLISRDAEGNDWYTLSVRRTGLVLAIPKENPPEGARLVQQAWSNDRHQEWTFLQAGTTKSHGFPTYAIANHSTYMSNPRIWRVADMQGGKSDNGNPIGLNMVQEWPVNNLNQVWMLVRIQ